mgnify:FL=1
MKFLADLFPVILFFLAYKLFGIYVATAVAIGASAVQVAYGHFTHGKVETMHWVTLGLLALFGGMTLLLQDPVFIKWKPTVVNWLFAGAFLASGLFMERSLIQRMMDHAIKLPQTIWNRLNFAWIGFFISAGVLNLYVAFNFSEDTWVNFKLFGLMGLTLVFVLAQGIYLARYLPAGAADSQEN